ncbi:cobalamin synthesis protein CobW [Mycolicibacterium aurum]|uniref:Cobalamin synthesis protein CobW n=1 Tax=Mycolicibacterium aurum TaxID=1791 RepID=A0A448J0B0_MYCAU|nr:cobalamin synthesis protein CobW [Mycolicibacterium aurum]
MVAGQRLTQPACDRLVQSLGTLVVRHRFDGQVVVRSVTIGRGPSADTSEWPVELVNCCVDCTIRDDLLILLRRLHRRDDVRRIIVDLPPWFEPEPVCWAINNVDVHVGPGYLDGPAARDVRIEATVSSVTTEDWLPQALGEETLHDDRTVAQVVVGQAEFADVLVLSAPDPETHAVLRRLSPRAKIITDPEELEAALSKLDSGSRRGRDHDPHEPLLAGEPPLSTDGDVTLVVFEADRPFHPLRLHRAIDDLLDGVVRVRGRAWLASQPDTVLWIESAGGGLQVGNAGTWLVAADSGEPVESDAQRLALASLRWNDRFGDRHISLTALLCGADPQVIHDVLSGALLTDDELSRPDVWADFDDPFGEWHEDPCETFEDARDAPWTLPEGGDAPSG